MNQKQIVSWKEQSSNVLHNIICVTCLHLKPNDANLTTKLQAQKLDLYKAHEMPDLLVNKEGSLDFYDKTSS